MRRIGLSDPSKQTGALEQVPAPVTAQQRRQAQSIAFNELPEHEAQSTASPRARLSRLMQSAARRAGSAVVAGVAVALLVGSAGFASATPSVDPAQPAVQLAQTLDASTSIRSVSKDLWHQYVAAPEATGRSEAADPYEDLYRFLQGSVGELKVGPAGSRQVYKTDADGSSVIMSAAEVTALARDIARQYVSAPNTYGTTDAADPYQDVLETIAKTMGEHSGKYLFPAP